MSTPTESHLVNATLTDEAAKSSLFNMSEETTLALVESVGGETRFSIMSQDITTNSGRVELPDNKVISDLFCKHGLEIARVASELAAVYGLTGAQDLVEKRCLDCCMSKDEVRQTLLRIDGCEQPSEDDVNDVHRALVELVLSVLQDTYISMSDGIYAD